MPTLDDLRAAFDAKADEAPAPGDLLAGLQVTHRGPARRTTLLVAAVVVLVAAAVLVPTTLLRDDGRGPAAIRPSAPVAPAPTPAAPTTNAAPRPTAFRFHFAFDDTAHVSFLYNGILPHRQTGDLILDGSRKEFATVTVYDAGAVPASLFAGGDTVRIGTTIGHVVRYADPFDPTGPSASLAVAWQYAPGAFATVTAADPSTTSAGPLIAAARRVRFDRGATLLVPFRVGYLPPGVVRESVGASIGGGVAGFTDGGRPDPRMPPFPGLGSGFEVTVGDLAQCGPPCTVGPNGRTHVARQGGYDLNLGVRVQVHGRKAFYDRKLGIVWVIAPNWYYTVGFSGGGTNRFTESELLAVARSVVVAPRIGDQSTWFDAQAAIPS